MIRHKPTLLRSMLAASLTVGACLSASVVIPTAAHAATGVLAITPANGFDDDLMTFDTPQACTMDANGLDTNIQVSLSGGNTGGTFGLVQNSSQSAYTTNSHGGLTIPSGFTVRSIASSNGFTVPGQTYNVTAICRRSGGNVVFDTFTNTITFGTTTNSSLSYAYTAGSGGTVATPTTTTVSPSSASITTAQSVVLTAGVTPAAAPGTFEFDVAGTPVATIQAVGGSASYSFSPSNPGVFAVTATFHATAASGYADSAASDPSTIFVTNPAPPVFAPTAAAPTTVSGSHVTGGTLACTAAAFTGTAPITTSLQWLRNGSPIGGATASTYTAGTADFGRTLSCRSTGSNTVGAASSDSAGLIIGAGPAPSPKRNHSPVIKGVVKGKAHVGANLGLNLGSFSVPVKATKFQWLRNGKTIKKATRSSYKLIAADRHAKISCSITFSATGYATRVIKTATVSVV